MGRHVNYSGFVVAAVGFFLTRFTVTLAIYNDPLNFYLAGVLPLALGLSLAAFGVALAIADVDRSFARTTAVWCVIGACTMLVLVVLTLLGSAQGTVVDFGTVRSRTYLSNFLIGGSVGGTLTGLYAARNHHQRSELEQQRNRLEVLNRLLRHEVLNAVSVIRGYSASSDDPSIDSAGAIDEYATAIEETIEEVKYLTRTPDASQRHRVDVDAIVERSVDRIRSDYPDAAVSVESDAAGTMVCADETLEDVFVHLLENAIVHATDDVPTVRIHVMATPTDVRVAVADDGPGLPEHQQRLLERGEIAEYDDPRTGFGLKMVKLLVGRYDGSIDTTVESSGTTVTVGLERESTTPDSEPGRAAVPAANATRTATAHLPVTLVAGLLAGVVYGWVAGQLGGSISFIGVYYGVQHAVVGWLTHEFHSVVFAFVYAGLLSFVPGQYRGRVGTAVAVGIGWSLVLWFGAAGVVSPIWLGLLGYETSLPNLSWTLLATHLSWGVSLGLLTAWGYEHVTPQVARLTSRLGVRSPTT